MYQFNLRLVSITFCYFFLSIIYSPLYAQYNINQGITVADCEGTLTDSNADLNNSNYGSNENYTFTVCIPSAASVLITFDGFSTEEQYDFLEIREGQGLAGVLMGNSPYSGSIPPPPTVIYNIDNDPTFCFTFHFVSDINVTDAGFNLSWAATLTDLPPLQPFTIPEVNCYAQTLLLNLNSPVLCSAISNDAFSVLGIGNPVIANTTPIACDAQGLTSQITITLASGITIGSQYDIIFNYEYVDACGNFWQSLGSANFFVSNCPLEISSISLSNELCDNCATITANVTGGDYNYVYIWDPPLGDIGSTLICPTESQWYSVTVSDGAGQSATQNVYVDVCPFQVNFVDAPSTVCGGGGCFNLVTEVGGGSPPYTYTWSVPPGGAPIGNNAFVAPYCLGNSGTFSVTVTDALGSTITNSFTTTVCPMQISISSADIECGCGNLVATATGGAGGIWGNDYYYTYVWSPPIAEDTPINSICPTNPAIYSVTVTDVFGLTASADVFVPVCPFQVNITAPDIVCGDCVAVTAEVSPPPSPDLIYTYNWDPIMPNGNVQSDTLCIVVPTIYYVTVTNQFGESVTASKVVDICPLQVEVVLPDVCSDACTDIVADAVGGAMPYTYQWSDPTLSGSSSPICVTAPNTYSVTVTDADGATVSASQNVVPCELEVEILAPSLFCHCDSIFAKAIGGSWAYSYAWNPPLPATAGWHWFCLEDNTTYSVTVTDLGTGETATATRELAVCPFEVTLEGPIAVCNNMAQLQAVIEGGYAPYTVTWNVAGIPPTEGLHTVPITELTEFIVTISDSTGYAIDDTLWVMPQESPSLPDTLNACLYDLVTLVGNPLGGTWSGNYIDPIESTFNSTASGLGNFWVVYSNDYCSDSMVVSVKPEPFVSDTVYCAGDTPLSLPLASLPNGIWAGGQVTDPAGLFTPDNTGIFPLTYTAPNGCTAQNTVTVLQGVDVNSPVTQICSSPLNIDEFPSGGVWDAAPGLDAINGILYPNGAGIGEHTLYYRLPGSDCADSITITVTNVAIGTEDMVLCPQSSAFILPAEAPTSGGDWTSLTPMQTGLTTTTGLYNPALAGSGYEEYVVYSLDGCSDTLHISVIPTLATPDTLRFCRNDNLFDLTDVGSPAGGTWSGDGVIYEDNTYYFDRYTVGTYTLTYSANNCDVELTVMVSTVTLADDMNLCNPTELIVLPTPVPVGGTWSGAGIVESGNGIFNPMESGSGLFPLVYTAPLGCMDTLWVNVSQTDIPEIMDIDPFFCLQDNPVQLNAEPSNGVWSGNGVVGNAFSPSLAGAGGWLLTYTYGTDECITQAYLGVSVGDTLRVNMSPDTLLCLGDEVVISGQAYGGKNNAYAYTWSHGLDGQQIHRVSPTESTVYSLTVSDGCSPSLERQVAITVVPPPDYTLQVGDSICYGDIGTATLTTAGNSYNFSWQHDPTLHSASITAEANLYTAIITDSLTGCSTKVPVNIPHHPLVAANFEATPNSTDCFPTLTLQFTDYSVGIEEGYWDFGDGNTAPYKANEPPSHTYSQPGTYTVILYAENEYNCQSVYQQSICLKFENDILLPTAFSPNNDEINDVFRAVGIGIDAFELHIYNRWGQRVFSTSTFTDAWDGTFNQQPCEMGAYSFHATYSTVQSNTTQQLRGNLVLIR